MTFNSKMIELARTARGVTQKKLSDGLPKLNQANLSKVERGEFNPSDSALQAIASELKFPVSFFFQEEMKTPFSSIYFRKRTTIPQKQFDIIFAEIRIVMKAIDYLMEDIEITEYPKYRFDKNEGWEPVDVALKARELLRVQPGPVDGPIRLLEQAGIIIYFYNSPSDKFDGLTGYTDGGYPVIVVNRNMPNDRIRFSLIHELGHLLMHIPCEVEPWRDEEAEANEIVGEFYMPSREARADLAYIQFNKLLALKSYWGLSKASIIYHAKRRKFITEEKFKYLMIELGRRGERKVEPGFVLMDRPTILDQVIRLHQKDGATEKDLAERVRLSIADYRRYFDVDAAEPKIRHMRPVVGQT